MDGRIIENLPALEGICILNIPSWGAGVRVWGEGENIPVQKYKKKLRMPIIKLNLFSIV